MKKAFILTLTALLFSGLLCSCTPAGESAHAAPKTTPASTPAESAAAPTETEGYNPFDRPSAEAAPSTETRSPAEYGYTDNSPEFRALLDDNPIDKAMDADFISAVTTEDFTLLSAKYLSAWEAEYHALMDQLITLYPDRAEELADLREWTDKEAQRVYEEAYKPFVYQGENGQELVGSAADFTSAFAKADVFKENMLFSLLNEWREDTSYVFLFTRKK